jgi:hypothetical protein
MKQQPPWGNEEFEAMLKADQAELPPELEVRMRHHLKRLQTRVEKAQAAGNGAQRGWHWQRLLPGWPAGGRKRLAWELSALAGLTIIIMFFNPWTGDDLRGKLRRSGPDQRSLATSIEGYEGQTGSGGASNYAWNWKDTPQAAGEEARPTAGPAEALGRRAGAALESKAAIGRTSDVPAGDTGDDKTVMNFAFQAGGMLGAYSPANSPGADAQTPNQTPTTVPDDRKIIYTAELVLRVANLAAARDSIHKLITEQHAVLARSTLTEIVFRVVPAKFDATLEQLAQLGDVARRNVQSEDVTAQYRDVVLRIEVAEGSRKRLMEILARAGKLSDVLEVERDIRRLTEEIEQLKGQQRVLSDRVELATVCVQLQEKELVQRPHQQRAGTPFGWIYALGMDAALAQVPAQAKLDGDGWWRRTFLGPRFRFGLPAGQLLPAGFVPLMYDERQLLAATPENHRLRVVRLETHQTGMLDYWTRAVADEFRETRGYVVPAAQAVELKNKALAARVLHCSTNLNSQPWQYDLWLVQKTADPKILYAIEYARPKTADAETLKGIEAAVAGFEVK